MTRALIVALAFLCPAANSASAAELVGFDTYPDGSPVLEGFTISNQWRALGVVFTMGDSSRAAYAVPHSCSRSAPNHVGGDPAVLAWFVDPVTGAPAVTDFVGVAQDLCWGPGEGILMQAFDVQGLLVREEFNSGSGNMITFSFAEPTVAMIRMLEFQQGIDDFTFNRPVPPGSTGVDGEDGAGHRGMPGARLWITPNPLAGSGLAWVSIESAGEEPLSGALQVFDSRGGLIRSLLNGTLSRGRHLVEWNGRDDRGVPVPTGTYFIRWSGSGRFGATRMTILR